MTNPVVVLLSRFATSRPVCSLEPPGLGRSPLRLDKCNHLISRAACDVAKTSAAKAHDKAATANAQFFLRSGQIFTVGSPPVDPIGILFPQGKTSFSIAQRKSVFRRRALRRVAGGKSQLQDSMPSPRPYYHEFAGPMISCNLTRSLLT